MEITRRFNVHGTFCPSAINVLDKIPEHAVFHVQQRLRHPDSIYWLSLEKVASAFCRVTKSYLAKIEECKSVCTEQWEMNELLSDQERFLHAIQEHLDELWLVLKTLIDPSVVTKPPLFADKYVIENRLPGAKSYQQSIASYKNELRITNKLKHQQAYLRGVVVSTSDGPHLGYFP